MSQAELGRILHVSRAAIHSYLDGTALPGRKTAAAIEELTSILVYEWDGRVPIVTHPTGCGCADCRRGID